MDGEQADNEQTAFPASETTPGQAESRSARLQFLEKKGECPWWEEYQQLRSEGWSWRIAAYIAWASTPYHNRWPENQEKLALEVLGLRSDRTIRNWRRKNPKIDQRVGELQVEPLFRHKADVINALIDVAKTKDPKAHPDRRMFLEITGVYRPKAMTALVGADGGPVQTQEVSDFEDMSDDELDQVIRNLSAAG